MNSILDWLFEHFQESHDAHTWAELLSITIIDPDGWRNSATIGELPIPPIGLDVEIDLEEFLWRLSSSTISGG